MMGFNRRLNSLKKAIDPRDGKEPVIFFELMEDNTYKTKVKGESFTLSQAELAAFKKEYGTADIVGVLDNIPKQ